MFARSATAAEEAHRMLALCLDECAPHGLVDFFTAAAVGVNRRSELTVSAQ